MARSLPLRLQRDQVIPLAFGERTFAEALGEVAVIGVAVLRSRAGRTGTVALAARGMRRRRERRATGHRDSSVTRL